MRLPFTGAALGCDLVSRLRRLLGREKTKYDSVAQSVEQLPFKPWVRGSSPRWVTKLNEDRLLKQFLDCFESRPSFYAGNAVVSRNCGNGCDILIVPRYNISEERILAGRFEQKLFAGKWLPVVLKRVEST